MELAILKQTGEETGRKITLSEDIFSIPVLPERLKNKKVPVAHVLALSNLQFSEEEEEYSALSQETTLLS